MFSEGENTSIRLGRMDFAVKKADLRKNSLPWEFNKEGPHGALVIRYWGCSLSCAVCYSQSYAYLNGEGGRKKASYTLAECRRSISNLSDRIGWVRIQGGEPLLDFERAIFTSNLAGISLGYMEHKSPYDNPRVIIQTNGLWLGNEHEENVEHFLESLLKQTELTSKGRIVIELSFKGPNRSIIGIYGDTLKRYKDILGIQKKGFYRLMNFFNNLIWKKSRRMAFYPVGGFGPQLSNPSFIPIDKKNESEYPLFHPDTWDEDFKNIVKDFRQVLNEKKDVYFEFTEKHDHKIPIECMEPSFFQKGWTSQLKKRELLRSFLRDYLRVRSNPQLKIFNEEIGNLKIGEAKGELLLRINDLRRDFYEAEPSDHYPFL